MKQIAIGDVHGCLKTLDRLLEKLELTADMHLIFVGDYVDRGPDSKGVIQRLIELREHYTCTFLRGNHESMFLEYLEEGVDEIWSMNGGRETVGSYLNGSEDASYPDDHVEFVQATTYFHETEDYFFVHAGLKPFLTIEENKGQVDPEVFLWERSHLNVDEYAWEKVVVCGHTPVSKPIDHPQLINIDTGCVYRFNPLLGKLTAVILPEREFVIVRNTDW